MKDQFKHHFHKNRCLTQNLPFHFCVCSVFNGSFVPSTLINTWSCQLFFSYAPVLEPIQIQIQNPDRFFCVTPKVQTYFPSQTRWVAPWRWTLGWKQMETAKIRSHVDPWFRILVPPSLFSPLLTFEPPLMMLMTSETQNLSAPGSGSLSDVFTCNWWWNAE